MRVIGRERELARLREVLDGGPGVPRAVFLTGAAGIGKSTLLAAGRTAAEAAGALVLDCAGLQSDMPVGFADLHELLHPLLPRTGLLPERQRAALAGAFGEEPEGSADPLLVRLAVLGLLEEAASERAVVLVVDDWQWLDPSTRGVLGFVARHLSGPELALLAAVRVEPDEPFMPPAGERLDVPALEPSQAREVVAALGEALPARDRDLVVRFAQGNPLALGEFRHAARSGESLEDSLVFPERLPVSARLERAFASELRTLPELSRRLLLVAVAGVDLTVAELLQAAAAIGATAEDFAPLEDSGLMTTRGDRLRFRHPFVRSTVYARASLGERLAAHGTLAGVVQDPSRRAWHRAGATVGPDEEIAAELEAAAGVLEQRGALPEAAAALTRAAELTGDDEGRARRLVAAAERARRSGLADLAGSLVERARPLATGAELRLALHTVQLWNRDSTRPERPDLRPFADFARLLATRPAGDFDEDRLKLLWPMAPLVWLHDVSGPEIETTVEALLALRTPDWNPWKWLLLLILDPPRFAAEVRPRTDELLAAWARDLDALPVNFAHAFSALQNVSDATAAHQRARDFYRGIGSVADEGRVQVALATALTVTGRLRDGLSAAELAVRIGEALNLPMQTAGGHATRALAYAWLGEGTASRQALAESETVAPVAWPIVHAHRNWARGVLALGEARHADAYAALQETAAQRTAYRWAIADLVEAAVRSGRPGTARNLLEGVADDVRAFGSAELEALSERGWALLGGPGAQEHFERSLSEGAKAGTVLQQARTQLLFGQWLRRERRVLEARAHLEAARDTFAAAGARPWRDQALAELTASGVRARRRPVPPRQGDLDALTDQERQIAELAAQGLTNKEIADRLYLSHRTVGSHLYRVFPKLGITQRSQLRDALGEG